MNPVPPPVTIRLDRRRKWRLALGLLVIYYPVDVFIFNSGWASPGRETLSQLLQFSTLLVFYVGWLYVAEWVLQLLSRWFTPNSLVYWKLPVQLTLGAVSVVAALIFTTAYYRTTGFLDHTFTHVSAGYVSPGPAYQALFKRAAQGSYLVLLLSGFYLLASQHTQLRAQALQQRTEQLEKEALRTQLAALRHQVNPHFLFNSLSILAALIPVDAAQAEQFVEHLADAYRYTLEQRDHELVLLDDELAFIDSYAQLLHLRFGEKFALHLAVPPAARQAYRLAPMTLQLLVENAVKHNYMSPAQPLGISIRLDGDELVISNPLQRRAEAGPQPVASTGVGLRNIQHRYRLLTSRPVQAGTEGPYFTVRIPLLPTCKS